MIKKDSRGNTALHEAVSEGSVADVNALLAEGADVNISNKAGYSPLHFACNNDHINIVKILCEAGADSQLMALDGVTPMSKAIGQNNIEIVKLFLQQPETSSDINKSIKGALLSVHYNTCESIEMVNFLLEQGADINAVDIQGRNSLHKACQWAKPNIDLIRLLIDAGADLHCRDERAIVPVQLLQNNSFSTEAKSILLCKKELNDALKQFHEKDERYNLTLHQARGCHAKYFSEILPTMLEYTPNTSDISGNTFLHWAACQGDLQLLQGLLGIGADVEAQNTNGDTALMLASMHGREMCVEVLIDSGANIQLGNHDGATALHLAVEHGHSATVAVLLLHGADHRLKNKLRKTPHQITSVEDVRRMLATSETIDRAWAVLNKKNTIEKFTIARKIDPGFYQEMIKAVAKKNPGLNERLSDVLFQVLKSIYQYFLRWADSDNTDIVISRNDFMNVLSRLNNETLDKTFSYAEAHEHEFLRQKNNIFQIRKNYYSFRVDLIDILQIICDAQHCTDVCIKQVLQAFRMYLLNDTLNKPAQQAFRDELMELLYIDEGA